ncbi:MAG: hypothetical protein KAT65_03920 [Methanophagales archaeon]|nr:hypothetical protein [Methanophagales archaeon]
MAVSFTKNYSIDVTFKLDDGGTIADDDLNPSVLREEIIKKIEQVCRISKGIVQARPSSVIET